MTKHILLTAALFLLYFLSVNGQNRREPMSVSMQEAIDKGMIKISIEGAYDPYTKDLIDKEGLHYGKCMNLEIRSKIDTSVFIMIDAGLQLMPKDTIYQTMVVTQYASIWLDPRAHINTRIYAMCGQMHDEAPILHTTYTLGNFAENKIVKLATYLSDNHIQNIIGQHALWAYTDNATRDELVMYGADSVSIEKTKNILYDLGIETILTPKKVEETPVVEEVKELAPAEVEVEQTGVLSINIYLVYAASGLLIVLLISTIVLLVILLRQKRGFNN